MFLWAAAGEELGLHVSDASKLLVTMTEVHFALLKSSSILESSRSELH